MHHTFREREGQLPVLASPLVRQARSMRAIEVHGLCRGHPGARWRGTSRRLRNRAARFRSRVAGCASRAGFRVVGKPHPAIHFAIHGDVVRGFLEANNVPPAAPPRPCACAPCEHLRQPPSQLPLRRRSNNFKRSSHAASRIRHERLRPTQRRPWAARRGAARPGRPQEGAAALRVQGRWHRRHSAQSAAQAQQVPANRPAPGQ